MSKCLLKALLITAALLLSACSLLQSKSNMGSPWAWLNKGTKVMLPDPGITPAISTQQLLTGTFNNKQQSLIVMLNANETELTLAGLSTLGIRLFLMTYNDDGLATEQSIVVPQLPPAPQVLLDVMLSHWPLSAWEKTLPKGWKLIDEDNKRELRTPTDTLVMEITYRQTDTERHPIQLIQHAFGYRITFEALEH